MLLLNPSRAQRSIALGRQASTKPRCHLALQPELKHTGGLLAENPSLGGSSTAAGAASTLGPPAADTAAPTQAAPHDTAAIEAARKNSVQSI